MEDQVNTLVAHMEDHIVEHTVVDPVSVGSMVV